MVIGVIAAAVNGASMPAYAVLFGEVMRPNQQHTAFFLTKFDILDHGCPWRSH